MFREGPWKNPQQLVYWWTKAAKQGEPDAQVTLGQMYEDGEGIPQDYLLAAYWYRKAADHVPDLGGAGVGLNSVAQLYQEGHATQEDYVFVYLWFAVAGDADGLWNVTKKMNTTQLTEAQRRTIEWFHPRSVCSSAMGKDVAASQPQ